MSQLQQRRLIPVLVSFQTSAILKQIPDIVQFHLYMFPCVYLKN